MLRPAAQEAVVAGRGGSFTRLQAETQLLLQLLQPLNQSQKHGGLLCRAVLLGLLQLSGHLLQGHCQILGHRVDRARLGHGLDC